MDPKSLKDLDNQMIQSCLTDKENQGGSTNQRVRPPDPDIASSSASSVYSTAEEDFDTLTEDSSDLTNEVSEPMITATKTWVTGTTSKADQDSEDSDLESQIVLEPLITAKKAWVTGTKKADDEIDNASNSKGARDNLRLEKISNFQPRSENNTPPKRKNSDGKSTKTAKKVVPGEIGDMNKIRNDVSSSSLSSYGSLLSKSPATSLVRLGSFNNKAGTSRQQSFISTTEDEDDFHSVESFFNDGKPITVQVLQSVFDCFKLNNMASEDCERMIDYLGTSQNRNDFQWALHQLGGFNALLFLYARTVELCSEDDIQSKGLSLVLSQIKNHSKSTDTKPRSQYNLIRFVLNSDKSTFGFKSFIILVHHCLTSSGNKLIDFELLETCLLSSWRALISVRCTEAEAPTGRRCLFECLLTVILDLLLEKNVHRGVNIAMLKVHKFADLLLAICYNMIFDCSNSSSEVNNLRGASNLSSMDALRIAALVKSIFSELMAPPDAYVGISIVKCGLYPLLPKELPPLPRKEDAFFVFQNRNPSSLNSASEAEEMSEDNDNNYQILKPDRISQRDGVNGTIMLNEDVPEMVGKVLNNNQKVYEKETFDRSQFDGFRETFQESLVEALMTVLLNALAIIPDGAFFSVLRPHLNAHIFVSYCSHPTVGLKVLSLKLLSAFLSRVKNPCMTEFLKNKGFFLASLHVQKSTEVSNVVGNICQGFGPVSFPLVVGLLHSTTVLSTVLQWVQIDEGGVIPALLSMGLIPAVMNAYNSSYTGPASYQQTLPLPRNLSNLISHAIKFCTLNAKDDPWKILLCPALECAPQSSHLTGRFYQEATELLKNYRGKELKKVDASSRLIWLLERACSARCGTQFDRWFLDLLIHNIMDCDIDDETEAWKFFVKKNKKRLTYLMGIFLCRVFIPNKGDFDFKQQTLRVLLESSPNLKAWLPKVLRSDSNIERCFTAFLRIFFSDANQRDCTKNNDTERSRLHSPSFQSLISESHHGNLISMQHPRMFSESRSSSQATDLGEAALPDEGQLAGNAADFYSDRTVRDRFEDVLVDAGILSPTSNFSTFSADFKKFKILLDSAPICGVSYHELRHCIGALEKLRIGVNRSLSPSFAMITQSHPTVNGQNEQTNGQQNYQQQQKVLSAKGFSSNAVYFECVFESVMKYAVEVLESVTRIRTKQEIELVTMLSTREDDILARRAWWTLREQMGHPKAPWYFPEVYAKFWALDQSEGPGRVRLRLKREPLKVHNRFILPKHRENESCPQPLDYLFYPDTDEVINFPSIKGEIIFMRFCTRIIPGEEISGELIISSDSLYFIPELSQKDSSERFETVEVPLQSLVHILRRRYTLEDRAAETFVSGQSFLFVFRNQKDREEFVNLITIKNTNTKSPYPKSLLFDSSLTTMTNQWTKGAISNFDYLMFLNTAAGRTYCDLMQYPVFPFVLAKYDSPTLDLHAPQSYRDLKKPIAIQDPSKEEHFISTYNYLKRECDSAPFHYGSHYSNSGIVLHFLIRLPPYTQHFLRYQDGNFDIPDRSFHSLETTWRLASRESNTDFKEAIPEFYYLPEFMQNLQHFDFGVRQNGKRVDDVILPAWAMGDPRLFVLINRQALESNQVRKHLSDWVDLIFGYKQTGKAAVQSINVFHPSTYEGFEVDRVDDELLKKARKAMVSTYGQTPKKLFPFPHPRSPTVSPENCEMEVLDTVWGIRWGHFLGSPTCSELEVVNTREYTDYMGLFETPTRVVFWPSNTLIIGDTVVGSWTSVEIQIKSHSVYRCIGDEITVVATRENCMWIGHQSGRITVIKLSKKLDKVIETRELVGHYKAIKEIDLNEEFSTAISCSGEEYALLWDMNRITFLNVIEKSGGVDKVYSSRSTGDIAMVSLSTNSVTLTTINGFEIGTVQPDEKVETVCLSNLDPGRNVNLMAVGCDYGYIRFYSTWDLKFINEIKVVPLTSLAVDCIRYSNDARRLYCLSRNEEVSISVALQLPESSR